VKSISPSSCTLAVRCPGIMAHLLRAITSIGYGKLRPGAVIGYVINYEVTRYVGLGPRLLPR
jgi:hypothetical protein